MIAAYDPEDPYVATAINDSVRAGLVVYSIYWKDMGRANNSWYENNAGQNLFLRSHRPPAATAIGKAWAIRFRCSRSCRTCAAG